MSISFDGRVAIVTGAGGGLGRHYALHLAALGARVVVNDLGGATDGTGRSDGPAEAVAEEIRRAGGTAVASRHSVTDEADAMVAIALEAFGRVDVLVNNAGILRDKTLIKMSEADLRAVLDVHLVGSVLCTRAALPAMFAQGYGRIVLVTSSSGLYGLFGQSNYAAAKMGLVGFANAVKFELERKGVKINCLAPSAMTRMSEGLVEPEIAARLAPELVAPAVGYLASEACDFTGCTMTAGAGHFALDRMMESPGVDFDRDAPITPDMIAEHISEISDMTGARAFESGAAQLRKIARTEPLPR